MKLFVERWHVTGSWERLTQPEREQWMNEIGPAIEGVMALGIEYVCGASMRSDAGGTEFIAVWRVPDEQAEKTFRDSIDKSGWYTYFEQVNLCGDALELPELIGSLVQH